MQHTDVHHITVAGINPHEIAEVMRDEQTPFSDSCPSVSQQIVVNGQIVGGIVEVWTQEHLTSDQEQFLHDMGRAIDVRHVYPEE